MYLYYLNYTFDRTLDVLKPASFVQRKENIPSPSVVDTIETKRSIRLRPLEPSRHRLPTLLPCEKSEGNPPLLLFLPCPSTDRSLTLDVSFYWLILPQWSRILAKW